MKKIKTSLSLEPDRLERLKRLASRERRSVSQLVDIALDYLFPVIHDTKVTLEDLSPSDLPPPPSDFPPQSPATPKPTIQGATK